MAISLGVLVEIGLVEVFGRIEIFEYAGFNCKIPAITLPVRLQGFGHLGPCRGVGIVDACAVLGTYVVSLPVWST